MKVIHKKISLNDLKSRLPGIIPSLVDFWKIPYLYSCGKNVEEKFYSYRDAVKRASEYNINVSQLEHGVEFMTFNENNSVNFPNGNYGLIPSDIIIPNEVADNITEFTDIYVNIPKSGTDDYYDLFNPSSDTDPRYSGRTIVSGVTGVPVKIITYYTLNKWYSFFENYYKLIKNVDGKKSYNDAIEYYYGEIKVRNEWQETFYKDLDDKFIALGGDITYNWITSNYILQYSIPAKFVDAWKMTTLFYSNAIKWYRWFKEMYEKYGQLAATEDCKNDDCVKYINLGGAELYNDLKNWAERIDINCTVTNSASITIPISLSNSIDDFGEMSIFSNEWEEGVDYHNTLSSSAGTTIYQPYITNNETGEKSASDETYVIKSNNVSGYEYNDYYENVFKKDDWLNYTDYYISHNTNEFDVKGVTSYTFSPLNGKIIYNPEKITSEIPINKIENVCINGNTYEVIDGKYVELCYDSNTIADVKYRKNNKLPVFKDGSLEYAIFNGKRKYVEVDNGVEKIYFLKGSNCYDEGCNVKSGKYVLYNDVLYFVDDNYLTIEEDGVEFTYQALEGYFNYGSTIFYILNGNIVIPNVLEYDESTNSYMFTYKIPSKEQLNILGIDKFVLLDNTVEIYYLFEKKNCNIVSGYCDSKLDLIRRKEISTDDLGNELPGYFRSVVDINKTDDTSHYNVTYDECTLDILYKVGEVSELKNFGGHFIGNIITNIEFYYKDSSHKKVIRHSANEDNALDAINYCEREYDALNNSTVVNTMMCDITYYLGTEIEKDGTNYSRIDNSYGVKYIDSVYVYKKVGTFYLNDDEAFTFKYYLLSQDVSSIELTDFNDIAKSDVSTYFEITPMLYDNNGHLVNEELFGGFEKNNGVIATPVFRTEFNLASSMPQNIKADIYIDRGISAAYEKHLKLQEIKSVESIENMGNGYFKINKY